jgi:hypothetical protein
MAKGTMAEIDDVVISEHVDPLITAIADPRTLSQSSI